MEHSYQYSYQHALVDTAYTSVYLPLSDKLLCLCLCQRASSVFVTTTHNNNTPYALLLHLSSQPAANAPYSTLHTMSSLSFCGSRPSSPAGLTVSSPGSNGDKVESSSTIAEQRLLEDALQPTNASQEVLVPASSIDSSGGMDVVETPVQFRGLYGRIGTIVQRLPGHTPPPSLRRPLPGLATRTSRAGTTTPTRASTPAPVPAPALVPAPATGNDLPDYAPHNQGPYRTLPSQLDPNGPLAFQFIRGIANLRVATNNINDIDMAHVRLLSREGQPHLGGGMPAARDARRALQAAEQDLHEALETALATAQQNRTDGDQLAYLRVLLGHLQGWITDKEVETANYARRMENTVAHLTQTNAQLQRENQELGAELQRLRAELQRRNMRIEYLEGEVAEYAGYN